MTDLQPNDGFEWTQAPWGRVLRCRPLLDVTDHFFTAGDLELRADEREWAGVAALAGVPAGGLRLMRQVHGSDVAYVDPDRPWDPPEADALIGNDPAAALVVRVADCAPILIADRRTGAVAAVHAGWRSTRALIVQRVIARMEERLGSRPEDLIAAVGPALGACCGEMGEEVVESFLDAGHEPAAVSRWFTRRPNERPYFDLVLANRDQLTGAGVPRESVFAAGLCTKTNAGALHSYRSAGANAGRMAGVIRAAGASNGNG